MAGARPRLTGSEEPRLFTPPLRELTPETTLGFDCIEFAEEAVGVSLFPWQKWLLVHLLELREEDDTLRFRKVVVLVARQNGKSLMAEILALYFMYALEARLVLGTAQDLATAEDVWQDTLDLAEESDFLAPVLTKPKFGKGSKEFGIVDKGMYRVKAANRRGGRGARQVKLVVLDELREHQNWDAWGAITKTTNAVPEAMVLALSNAGDASSVVLRYLRLMAHKRLGDPDGVVADNDPAALLDESAPDPEELQVEDDDSLALFEWSAPADMSVRDRDGWAWANPSLPHTLTERTLMSDVASDPEWVFRTECLCQWSDGALDGPFPPGSWEAGRVHEAEAAADPIVTDPVACLEVSWDRSKAAVAYAGRREDGTPQVEIVHYRYDPSSAIEWLSSPERSVRPTSVTLRKSGPGASLSDDLERAGFEVTWWQGGDISQGCGDLFDAIRGNEDEKCGPLRHSAHTALDIAAATAATTPFGDRWSWDMKKSPTDICPLVAATGAYWLLTHPEPEPAVSAYEARGVLTI